MESSSPIELLLSELVILRAIKIRQAHSATEASDGLDTKQDQKIFIDQAVDELKTWHPYIMERLKTN
jgi:hypothetical protein